MTAPIGKVVGEGNCTLLIYLGRLRVRWKLEPKLRGYEENRPTSPDRPGEGAPHHEAALNQRLGQTLNQVKGEPRVSLLAGSDNSCPYPGKPACPECVPATLPQVRLASTRGTGRRKSAWAVQESAEVVVVNRHHQ